jgi:DNA invertase Pin-like site-specific DNA recombinase
MTSLERALLLLQDGASYTETAASTGLNRTTLSKKFPGYGWTHKEGGSYGLMIRNDNKRGNS